MSADDICHPDRIKIQVKELELYNAGVTFCRPQLINEEGQFISDKRWPIFFKRSFSSQEELYKILFDYGNFICATSVMFRAELINRHGYLHRGLVQLQDFLLFAHWASHTNFHMSEFRYLFYRVRENEGNLSSKSNQWRTEIEKKIVYRNFFEKADREFLNKVFGNGISLESSKLLFDIEKARLLLRHRRRLVRSVGAEMLIDFMRSGDTCVAMKQELSLTTRELYAEIAEAINASDRSGGGQISRYLKITRSQFWSLRIYKVFAGLFRR
jgi:hypothetical protein